MAKQRSAPNKPYAAGAAITGVNATLRAYSKLGKEARKATKVEVQKVAQIVADRTAAAGRARGGRDALLAGTAKAKQDRVPIVEYGGKQRAGVSGGATFSQLVYGMEFGAEQQGPNGWRFPPRTPKKGRGNEGYWIFPTARKMGPEIAELWFRALDQIAEEWGRE